ncbi:CDP-alcohol phosphatidyltransferase family protein [Paenibacillus tarimensis]
MNLPNLLTMARFIMIPVYLAVFAYGFMKPAFFVLLAAGLTDILDGYIARRRGQVTATGAMLDPLADKIMLIAVILSLLFSGHIPWSAAAVMFIRDAGMIIGSAIFHFRGKKTVSANWMGKLTTVLFYAAMMLIFFESPFALGFLWGVIGFSFLTSFIYIAQFLSLNREPGGKRSPM